MEIQGVDHTVDRRERVLREMKMKKLYVFLIAAIVVFCGSCQSKVAPHTFGGVGSTPIIPASWTVPAWFIDPANTSTTASDSNDCVTSVTACRTWHEINDHRWGCQGSPAACPRLQQATVINILSSQTSNTDPVYTFPAFEQGSYLQFKGTLPTASCTGILAGVVAKARTAGAPQLLNATLCGSAAIGQMVVNTTHPSRAFVYKLVSGTTWAISQPLAPAAGNTLGVPAEVDTWANGDSYSSYALFNFNFVTLSGNVASNINFNSAVFVYNLTAFDPDTASTVGTDIISGGQSVDFIEAFVQKYISFTIAASAESNGKSINSFDQSGVGSTGGQSYIPNFVPSPGLYAGVLGAPSTVFPISGLTTVFIDKDTIIGATPLSVVSGEFGNVYVDTGVTVSSIGSIFIGFSGGSLWGPGIYNQQTTGRTIYNGTATNILKITALRLNGGTTACSVGTGAVAVWNCGITLNAANLDAAVGIAGFGGVAYSPGGGSFVTGGVGGY